jgi:hypothetical protein
MDGRVGTVNPLVVSSILAPGALNSQVRVFFWLAQ